MVTDYKDGTPSENCVVASNIAFRSLSVEGTNVTERHNHIIGRTITWQVDRFTNQHDFVAQTKVPEGLSMCAGRAK
ncbi:MAG: hypothetical protein M0036_08875 [Desulfobacteraceae bacterium]|nr:hypothetical protein [Desulfobacteraceae bacterium]